MAKRRPTAQLISLRTPQTVGSLSVDRNTGVIDNVSIITLGPARSHGFAVDRVMMQQVVDSINAAGSDGVKSRITHPELEGADGVLRLVGKITNARIDGDRVRGTFTIGKYCARTPVGGSNLREYLLDLADESPTFLGFSIVFAGAEFEISDGMPLGRISDVRAVDLTDTPSANNTGLLSSGSANPTTEGVTAMGNLQDKLNSLIDAKAGEGGDRAAVIAALATAASLEVVAIEEILSGATACPTKDTLNAIAAELGAEANELVEAAVADGCTYEEVAPAETPAETPPVQQMSAAGGARKTTTANPGGSQAAKPDEQAIALKERTRITMLRTVARESGLSEQWINSQITNGTDELTARRLAMNHLKATNGAVQLSGGGDRNLESVGPALADALFLRASGGRATMIPKTNADGMVMLSENGRAQMREPHGRARSFMGMRLPELAREYLRALGVKVDGMPGTKVCQLVFNRQSIAAQADNVRFLMQSSSDFGSILADVMGKSLRQAYIEKETNWEKVFRRATAPDFKTIRRAQLSGVGVPPVVREGAEYHYAHLADGQETYVLVKYGHIISVTWETLINDDLDALSRVPTIQANAARRLEDDVAFAQITSNPTMADGTVLFHADHNNLGTTAALSVNSLGEARALLRKQRGMASADVALDDSTAVKTERLNLQMKHLLVPAALETVAEQLIGSSVDPAKSNNTPNPFNNKAQVVAEPRLDEASATAWYPLADSSEIDTVEVCFLEGETEPYVEEQDGFKVDGRMYKLRHTVASKAIDWRGMVKNAGS